MNNSMTYRGHIRNGVAVPDTPAALPEGTAVRIEVDRDGSAFRQNETADQLAREQEVPPVRSPDDLRGD